MRLYSRTGDRGETSLVDGTRVSKDAVRIEAYGVVDEASSWIGMARAFNQDPLLGKVLEYLQHRFYNCSGNLATPHHVAFKQVSVTDDDVVFIEQAIDKLEETTGELNEFVLPGGSQTGAVLHVARTVCRRAERRIWTLHRSGHVDETILKFINRTSDLLFAAARYANKVEVDGDITWNKKLPIPDLS